MGIAKRLAKGLNEGRKKKLLSKYTKKELKALAKASGKITLVQERRLLGVDKNAIGEPEVCFFVSIPELEAMIKSAKKTMKRLFKKGNGACIRNLNDEISMFLFEKKVG